MLPRIFAVAVGVNAVAVLVAAQFGAFKSIQREFGASKVVLLAPADAPKEKEKPVEKTKKEAPKPSTTKKAPGPANKSTSTPKNRLAQPKVVTGTGDAAGGGDTPAAAAGGNLAPGTLPTNVNGGTKPTTPVNNDAQPKTDTQPTTTKTTVTETKPTTETTDKPKPEPKFVECEVIDQPQPDIPDDLRSDELDKEYVAEFVVGPDGNPESVNTVQSTGINELDKVALEAAKKWKFKPATLGGEATTQTVRLKIEFRVQ